MSVRIKEINDGKDYQVEIYHYGVYITVTIDDFEINKIEENIKSIKEKKR